MGLMHLIAYGPCDVFSNCPYDIIGFINENNLDLDIDIDTDTEPDNVPLIYYGKRREETIKMCLQIKEELIMVAWDPDRHEFMSWCFDIEQCKEIKMKFQVSI